MDNKSQAWIRLVLLSHSRTFRFGARERKNNLPEEAKMKSQMIDEIHFDDIMTLTFLI